MELKEKKSQFWDMLFFERLWHLRLKWLEILNYVMDFIIAYCVQYKFNFFQNSSHIQKDVFHDWS
jgi:hypothetical protein